MQVSHLEHSEQTVCQAVDILRSGGLVVFPTETVYGIAASAASDQGIDALRAFKGRLADQPLTVHLPDPAAAMQYIETPHPMVQRLMRKTLPGPVTFVMEVDPTRVVGGSQIDGLESHALQALYHRNTIGLRCPDSPFAQEIFSAIGAPVVASSANAQGKPPPYDATEAAMAVGDAAQLVVDGGRCRYAKPSTIVRISQHNGLPTIQVERVGVYDERMIRKLMSWTIVVVCSGNTCRSPMAAALAKMTLANRMQVTVDQLPSLGINVISAGLFATEGLPVSPEARDEMTKLGIDLSQHRSKPLTPELIRRADVCYCMTQFHQHAVIEMAGDASDKIFLLNENGDVEDPIGLGPDAYHRCAQLIRRHVDERLKEQDP